MPSGASVASFITVFLEKPNDKDKVKRRNAMTIEVQGAVILTKQ